MSEKEIKPNQSSSESKREQVEQMFDTISKNYDFMNKMMTFGMDKSWRKKVLKKVTESKPTTVLDVATGTGDMPILLLQSPAKEIVGIDISKGMLEVANQKVQEINAGERIRFEVQDSEALTFATDTFDATTVLYGIRNFEHLEVGLKEIHRVLKEKGVFVILETSVPEKKFFKWGYLMYTKRILPFITRLFSDDKQAYDYLSASALNFPYGKRLCAILEKVGFKEVKAYPQFFGASTIYVAKK